MYTIALCSSSISIIDCGIYISCCAPNEYVVESTNEDNMLFELQMSVWMLCSCIACKAVSSKASFYGVRKGKVVEVCYNSRMHPPVKASLSVQSVASCYRLNNTSRDRDGSLALYDAHFSIREQACLSTLDPSYGSDLSTVAFSLLVYWKAINLCHPASE